MNDDSEVENPAQRKESCC